MLSGSELGVSKHPGATQGLVAVIISSTETSPRTFAAELSRDVEEQPAQRHETALFE